MKFIYLILGFLLSAEANAQSFTIARFGARAEEGYINTKHIQSAIDSCAASGGGTVIIPRGTFFTGTIFLRSHIHLYLEKGAVLKGSPDIADYKSGNQTFGLIVGNDVEDISISGEGEINGNCSAFLDFTRLHRFLDYDPLLTRQGKDYMKNIDGISDGPVGTKERPDMTLTIKHSSRIRIQNLFFTEMANWTMRIGECEDVIISGLQINNNRLIPNSDGIHCTTSRNVTISDCVIAGGDDGIIVTGFGDETSVSGYTGTAGNAKYTFGNKTGVSENITVSNCTIASSSAAIRVGYGKHSIRNVVFNNITIFDSNRGILVQCRDDMNIEHIRFENITMATRLFTGVWWGKGEPIHVSAVPQSGTKRTGKIRDISFTGISVSRAEAGIIVYGIDSSSAIEDISFRDIRLTIGKGPNSEAFGGNMDMRPAEDHKIALVKFDIPAFYGHGIRNLSIDNLSISWEKELPVYYKDAVRIDHFSDVRLNEVDASQPGSKGTVFSFADGHGLSVNNCSAKTGSDEFINTQRVSDFRFFNFNDLRNSRTASKVLQSIPAKIKTGNLANQ